MALGLTYVIVACTPQQETYYETFPRGRGVVRVLIVDRTGTRRALATASLVEDALTAVARRAGWAEASPATGID